MSMDAEFREFLKRYDVDRKKADEDRRKADEDRLKSEERCWAMMRRLEQNDQRIEKLMERSDRRERELARGLATIGKRILDTQTAILHAIRDTQRAIQESQVAILAELRLGRNGRSGGGPARN